MKLLLWAILGILCFMAGPVGWIVWWAIFALTLGWGLLSAFWLLLCGFFQGTGRLVGMMDTRDEGETGR